MKHNFDYETVRNEEDLRKMQASLLETINEYPDDTSRAKTIEMMLLVTWCLGDSAHDIPGLPPHVAARSQTVIERFNMIVSQQD